MHTQTHTNTHTHTGEMLDAADLAFNIYDSAPYYDDGYDAPFNQGNWDDNALPSGFPEMLALCENLSPSSPGGKKKPPFYLISSNLIPLCSACSS